MEYIIFLILALLFVTDVPDNLIKLYRDKKIARLKAEVVALRAVVGALPRSDVQQRLEALETIATSDDADLDRKLREL